MGIDIKAANQIAASTTLLNHLNNDKEDGLFDTLISSNRAKYEATLEKYGYSASGTSNSSYKKLETANGTLLDAISALRDENLYMAAEGEEYDNSTLITSVNNFVSAYNNSVSKLTSTGGALYKEYFDDLKNAFSSRTDDLNAIGLSLGSDGKISVDQDILSAASAEDVKGLLGTDSSYLTEISATLTAMNKIISTALSYSSSSYTNSGDFSNNLLTNSLLSTFNSSV